MEYKETQSVYVELSYDFIEKPGNFILKETPL